MLPFAMPFAMQQCTGGIPAGLFRLLCLATLPHSGRKGHIGAGSSTTAVCAVAGAQEAGEEGLCMGSLGLDIRAHPSTSSHWYNILAIAFW